MVQIEGRQGRQPGIFPFKRGGGFEASQVPQLSQAAQNQLRAVGETIRREEQQFQQNFERSMRDYRALREQEPKGPPLFDAWVAYCTAKDTERKESWERGVNPDAIVPAPLVSPTLPFDTTTPLHRQRNEAVAGVLHKQLAQEAYMQAFDLMAESIQRKMWHDTSEHPLTTRLPEEYRNMGIYSDGTTINRTQIGYALSYSTDRNKGESVEPERENKLSLGIGYFGKRSQIVPEAQATVSDEDLRRGVKAYYVRQTFVEKGAKKTKLVVVPLAYADALNSFFRELYDSAKTLAPERMLPSQQTRRFQRTALAA